MSNSSDSLRKVDRRMRLVLKSYGYAPNNDLIAQLIEAVNPLIEAHSLQEQINILKKVRKPDGVANFVERIEMTIERLEATKEVL